MEMAKREIKRAVCHKCGFEGVAPEEVRVGYGVGLFRKFLLDGPECADVDACLKRQQVMRWRRAFESMEGKEAECWVCHEKDMVRKSLTVAVDMLYVKKGEYSQVFEDVKWVHKDTQQSRNPQEDRKEV